MTVEQLAQILNRLYPSTRWPKPFGLLDASSALARGASLADIARDCETTKRKVEEFLAAADPIIFLFGSTIPSDISATRARQMLGNLIVGRCAERVFADR